MVYKTVQLYIQQLYEQLKLYVSSRPKHVQNTFIPVLTENWSSIIFLSATQHIFTLTSQHFIAFGSPFMLQNYDINDDQCSGTAEKNVKPGWVVIIHIYYGTLHRSKKKEENMTLIQSDAM